MQKFTSTLPDFAFDGEAIRQAARVRVACPQCTGTDDYCNFCVGDFTVTASQAAEWHTQNDGIVHLWNEQTSGTECGGHGVNIVGMARLADVNCPDCRKCLGT